MKVSYESETNLTINDNIQLQKNIENKKIILIPIVTICEESSEHRLFIANYEKSTFTLIDPKMANIDDALEVCVGKKLKEHVIEHMVNKVDPTHKIKWL